MPLKILLQVASRGQEISVDMKVYGKMDENRRGAELI